MKRSRQPGWTVDLVEKAAVLRQGRQRRRCVRKERDIFLLDAAAILEQRGRPDWAVALRTGKVDARS